MGCNLKPAVGQYSSEKGRLKEIFKCLALTFLFIIFGDTNCSLPIAGVTSEHKGPAGVFSGPADHVVL